MRFKHLFLLLALMPIGLNAQNVSGQDQTSDVLLPQLLKGNPDASIFYSALVATHLQDTLNQYLDPSYPNVDYEWTIQALIDDYPGIHRYETAYETGNNADRIAIPDVREFKYTLFVVPDKTLAGYSDSYWSGGIHNLNELRQYAEKVYPEGKGLPDDSRSSSLNKLISYHILPCWLPYDQFNTSQKELIKRRLYLKEYDVEDFFETLLPHSVMRISTPYPGGTWQSPLGIFINRKGTESTGLTAEGIKIDKDASGNCTNGGYHYINRLLVYDDFTRNTVLQTRMRVMASTMSPDFINSGGRGRLNGDYQNNNLNKMSMKYLKGYCRNVKWNEPTEFYVRYRDRTFGTYYGDEITLRGAYDITFRLPPVSSDGLYEIRIWNNSLASAWRNDRGDILFYFGNEADNLVPCAKPVDMHVSLSDPAIGGVYDRDLETQEAMDANDNLLRKHGFMKAPDSYTASYSTDNSGDPIRVDMNCYRKIVCETYMKADQDHYLRLRQMSQEDAIFPFSFIEIVPYSVYSGENGPEDKH